MKIMDIKQVVAEIEKAEKFSTAITFLDKTTLEKLYSGAITNPINLKDLESTVFQVYFSKSFMNVSVFGHKKVFEDYMKGYLFGHNLISGKKLMYFTAFQKSGETIIAYNVADNPNKMRNFIDKIVKISDGVYLGKLFQKRGTVEKFICYFWLEEVKDANTV